LLIITTLAHSNLNSKHHYLGNTQHATRNTQHATRNTQLKSKYLVKLPSPLLVFILLNNCCVNKQLIINKESISGNYKLPTTNLPIGVYIIKIKTENNSIETLKFIKN